ncbi:hypothetical protein FHR71_003636 [Methylobacterium sp. RAS18]|nr:hypothetical protein [Methylobacterium sp. RAS18]
MAKRSPRTAGGSARRVPVSTKILPDLRDRLEAAATAGGRTLGNEIERRLERSFLFKEELLALFEDEKTFSAACAVAMTWISLENVIGRPWYSDKDTLEVAKVSAASIIGALKTTSPAPPPAEGSDLDDDARAAARIHLGVLLSGKVQRMARKQPVDSGWDDALAALGGELFGDPPEADAKN